MKKVIIELYSIDELGKEAKNKVINEHKEFLLSVFDSSDYEGENYTYSQYKKDLTIDDVIENIEINNYLFFNNGSMANTLQYMEDNICKKHVYVTNDIEFLIE